MKFRVSIHPWLIALLVLAASAPAGAASLFEDHTVLELELTGPVEQLIKHKEDRQEWPFLLRESGTEQDVLISARGNSRMRICGFPPLSFNFEPQGMPGTVFEGQHRIKQVSHCRNRDASEQDALEEYAAYRIFELLTPVSYRVRLVHMYYNDMEGRLDEDARNRFGFLIEPTEQLAARVGGEPTEIPGVSRAALDDGQEALVYVFQYLIGNTDWSLVAAEDDDACCHNGDLIKIGPKLFLVPYDFDLAGIVSAKYARPDASLRIKRVSQRLYRGFCMDSDVLLGALRRITSMEDEILAVILELPLLSAKDKQKRVDYLGKFFEKANDKEKMMKTFEKACHP
jgi:hypothetical protein